MWLDVKVGLEMEVRAGAGQVPSSPWEWMGCPGWAEGWLEVTSAVAQGTGYDFNTNQTASSIALCL